MWQQEDAADAQQQARGGNSLISPLLSPLALHSSQNTATLVEQRRLDDETEMERKLAAEMHKVRSICTFVLVKQVNAEMHKVRSICTFVLVKQVNGVPLRDRHGAEARRREMLTDAGVF
jgi:hypothetical protein